MSFFLVLSILLSSLLAGELTYDMATGKISGFQLTNPTIPFSPISYENSTEVWQTDGFVVRLNYRGDPTTLTFTNTGPEARFTTFNRFYFTYNTDGTSRRNRWREFFLVTRCKGLYHNGNQHDYSGENSVVAYNEGTVAITKGAGPEEILSGEHGYNLIGEFGLYDGSNGYKFKHTYQYIWVDITIILTDQTRPEDDLVNGYYITEFTATDPTGLSYTLNLLGENPPLSGTPPSSFYFGIEKTIAHIFPFEELRYKNSMTNSLKVGTVRYFSLTDSVIIEFSSRRNRKRTNFRFTSDEGNPVQYCPYYVVFDPTVPNDGATPIDAQGIEFGSIETYAVSPIDGRLTYSNILEGDICIYVDANCFPMAGMYQSTIYCFITLED